MANKISSIIIDDFEKQAREKCGVVGVWSGDKLAPIYVRKCLSTLQHRGQESAGISFYTPKKKIETYNGMGLVLSVLTSDLLQKIGEKTVAMGHNRYSTAGSSNSCNAQPITLTKGKFQISIGHNGNIPYSGYLEELIEKKSKNQEEPSDTHLVAELLLQEREKYKNWDETIINTLPLIKGAFCFVILTDDGSLYGARDPYGIRPFCLGKIENGWVIASESIALDLVGAEFLRDIKPGEIIKISFDGKLKSYFYGIPAKPQHCLFEYIYFSRPDSFENGIRVRSGREASGKLLAKRILTKGIKADAVVPVFDSGYPAAKGVALELGLPLVDAITVSHYTGRTFIQPGHENRIAAVNGKHNVVPDEIIGKRIIVVDDSGVRLTTSKRLSQRLYEAGAKSVYMVFASPPVIKHCDMGIDMKSKKELPASEWGNETFEVIEKNVAKLIGADGVVYLPIDDLAKALGRTKKEFYYYPFGGPHPIRGEQYDFPKLKKKLNSKPKIAVFIYDTGTNLQNIIDHIKSKDISGEIVSVISNKKDAFGFKRAEKNNIPTFAYTYEGKLNDKKNRKEYDQNLIAHIKNINPDIIVLSGWKMILGDDFLTAMTKLEIPVINLHPALLTQNLEDHIATSRGVIPVIRGSQAIKKAFEKNYRSQALRSTRYSQKTILTLVP